MSNAMSIELNDDHLDFMVELLTIGAGRSSEILSEMLGTHIQLSIPSIVQCSLNDVEKYMPHEIESDISVVDLQFQGDISGESKLIFPLKSAQTLGNILLDEDEEEDFDSIKIGVLTEVGNIVLNSIMGTISNFLHISFDYQIPIYQNQFKRSDQSQKSDNNNILLANTKFIAEEVSVEGEIALLFSLESLENLINLMNEYLKNL